MMEKIYLSIIDVSKRIGRRGWADESEIEIEECSPKQRCKIM
jgi:hypothetical protein